MTKKDEMFLERRIKKLNKFFGIKLKGIKIIELKSREEINKINKRKTPDWMVGWTDKNKIYILSKNSFEKYSCHNKKDFEKVLNHELVHLYLYKISKSEYPVWLNEGLAIFLSKQIVKNISIEEAGNSIKFFKKHSKLVYQNSGKIVERLYKKFGKNKLLKLIKSINKNTTKKDFNRIFKDIYGFKLTKKEIVKNLK